MQRRRLDVSTGAGGMVAVKRTQFDQHVNECEDCACGHLCARAETLWRGVCFAALAALRVTS